MLKSLLIASVALVASCNIGFAQGPLRGKKPAGRIVVAPGQQTSTESNDKRQDVEGAIWEFKVFDHTEKDLAKAVHMTGKIRVKQSSVFAVGKVKFHNQENKEEDGEEAREKIGNENLQKEGLQSQLRNRLSQKLNRKEDEQSGGERIGDISKGGSNKYKYQFDQDDQYPLSGLVSVTPDPQKKNGVWSGNYEEFSAGKKVKRWRFEMRKIEE
ncbi:hypothetical protein SH139x_002190 [Planctomycetaceae bacterium SH139]